MSFTSQVFDRMIFQLLDIEKGAKLALGGTIAACSVTTITQFFANERRKIAFANNDQREYPRMIRLLAFIRRNAVCSRRNFLNRRYHTLFTSAWTHGNLAHLLCNMIGLWSFGRLVAGGVLQEVAMKNMFVYGEKFNVNGYAYGFLDFVGLFYGGILAGDLFCFAIGKRGKENEEYVGASSGICALSAVAAATYPRAQMLVGLGPFFMKLPAPLATISFAVYSLWAETNGFQDNTGHMGHLGGLLYGLLWYTVQFRTLPWVRHSIRLPSR